MQRASDLFSEEQREQIEKAVIEAEAKTACEVVPVVATASGRYDRAEDIIGLWLAVFAAIAVWLMFPRQSHESGSWSGAPLYVGLVAMVSSVVVGSQLVWLRRLFIPRKQILEEVTAPAREVFFDKRVHHTGAATGMLIYVSLFERTAVVLGDQQVLEKIGQTSLDRLCQQLTEGLRRGDATVAICSVIAEAGKQLSGPLPRNADDVNELQDSLVLID